MTTHATAFTRDMCRLGRRSGRRRRYHKKYWDVQTLLNITNTDVWMNQENMRAPLSVEIKARPMPRESRSCGRKLVRGDVRSVVGVAGVVGLRAGYVRYVG